MSTTALQIVQAAAGALLQEAPLSIEQDSIAGQYYDAFAVGLVQSLNLANYAISVFRRWRTMETASRITLFTGAVDRVPIQPTDEGELGISYPIETLAPGYCGMDNAVIHAGYDLTGITQEEKRCSVIGAVDFDLYQKISRMAKAQIDQERRRIVYMIRNNKIYFSEAIPLSYKRVVNGTEKTIELPYLFNYKTRYSVIAADGTMKEYFDKNTDTTVWDKYIMVLGVCYFYRNMIGENNTLDMQVWQQALQSLVDREARQTPIEDVKFNPAIAWRGKKMPFINGGGGYNESS
jgi:hypothetical protein